ncbi:purine-nucleoside phosphorylase [Clostridium frigidicarnis]|uniref:Purine nucleoside phosphorylase DeoD-type n=1 Tax=Clostridium frigidicarnis TaxID=84698 RepID=A0A1I0WWP0_9CLOT|nr:purine-nucleoside phosphorylase [Clostridium frigidicarnis]SFA92994.1 purine-nucleoside phosphorylase [Clostridium frigidicarnis]
MSIHINAKKDSIADTILLPGDPLRAKYIAENFLENVICYNDVRGMYGFTGIYRGRKISVQGTGMGVPSISIYTNELITSYNVEKLIRIGTAGSIRKDVKVRDVVMAMSACHDSNINSSRFPNMTYSPTANFELLKNAYDIATSHNLNTKVGSVLTTDSFYQDDFDHWKKWADFGCLAIEMETAALYTLASKYNKKALSLLTISDSLVTGEETSAFERQTTFNDMIEVALEL